MIRAIPKQIPCFDFY